MQNRNNFVYLRQTKSQIITNQVGVPQGSVLGPLFLPYLLSVRIAKLSGKYFIYADDAALIYSHKNTNELKNICNNDLIVYYNWLLHNNLKLNESKTVYYLNKKKYSRGGTKYSN